MNSNYSARSTTFAVEKLMEKTWTDVATSSHALLCAMKGVNGYNSGFEIESRLNGTKALVPILASTFTASGVTKSGQYTAMSISELSSAAMTHAEYSFATYRNNFTVDYREREFLSGEANRGLSIIDAKIQSLTNGFHSAMGSDLNSSTDGSDSKLMGVKYVLSTSNTVGNISQSSQSSWRANVRAVNAAFNVNHILEGINESRRDTIYYGIETPKLIIATESSSQRLYSTILNSVPNNTTVLVNEERGQFGWPNQLVSLWGARVVAYSQGSTGEVMFLDPMSWFFGCDDVPHACDPVRVPGMSVDEYHYITKCVLGCKSPARNTLYTGIS